MVSSLDFGRALAHTLLSLKWWMTSGRQLTKSVTLLVTIDFSRAFDIMNIDVLIDKLVALGFSDSACNWIRLDSNRSESVIHPDGNTSTLFTDTQEYRKAVFLDLYCSPSSLMTFHQYSSFVVITFTPTTK